MTNEHSSVDVRRERLMMRAFQNRLVGPVLRKLANPQDIIEDGMAFWSSRLMLTPSNAACSPFWRRVRCRHTR